MRALGTGTRRGTRGREACGGGTRRYDGALPPLPVVQFASARPAPMTRAAYEFAARHPEVLKHVPCFCGCERNGHGNNEDCFIARREGRRKSGVEPARHRLRHLHRRRAWPRGKCTPSGARVADIRRAIDQKYKADYPTSTPTPHPH